MKRVAITALLLLATALPGCERKEGPMEKAGEKIDEAVDKITHPNEGPLERAGRRLDDAIEDARESVK